MLFNIYWNPYVINNFGPELAAAAARGPTVYVVD